ncbi:MAG TPA: SDR family NAD(P)-dependent oxidoreductase, partial [Ideonella sp.]|uniref:SDR family NAD(P)-dependent oxidoreductase n=1 Tax=Ideonella sp. TaxID=1929293 RepID=UPI002B6AA138
NIDFEGTPFVVQQELTDWLRPTREVGGRQQEGKRIAGISSFGAGGANAHVVIEEYSAPEVQHTDSGPALIVLSARNEDRLNEQVRQLRDAIEAQPELSLADLAYTLQVGREAMEERLGLVVSSMEELRRKLDAHAAGDSVDELYRGQVKRNKEALAGLSGDEDTAAMADAWIAKGKFDKLLDLWVKGMAVDWQRLYGAQRPQRISLPTYPFARERYWLDVSASAAAPAAKGGHLHPLLHRNTSSFAVQRFSSHFSGEEFFFADHAVKGTRILPGVAQLEMARHAMSLAMDEDCLLQLRDIAWLRPVVAGADGVELHIALLPQASGDIRFEIYSDAEGDEPRVHCQGAVVMVAGGPSATAAMHDLVALRAQCSVAHLDATQCYAAFDRMGLHYGPAFQGLNELLIGDGEVLARVALPASAPADGYGLHPSLLDAALQATLGLLRSAGHADDGSLWLPATLGSLDLLAPCGADMWAVLRSSAGKATGGALPSAIDVDLCDEHGNVCVRLSGLGLHAAAPIAEAGTALQTLLAKPVWEAKPVAVDSATGRSFARHLVMLCGLDAAATRQVQAELPDVTCVAFAVDENLAQSYASAAETLLAQLQSLSRQPGQHRVQLLVPQLGTARLMAGLGGMLRTAQRENPSLLGQVIQVEPGQNLPQAVRDNRDSPAADLRYIGGERQVGGWAEWVGVADAASPWQDQGVYLITGGAGGLGLIFAREIARQAKGARLVLTGRSPLNASAQAALDELAAMGAEPQYRQLDVGDSQAVTRLVGELVEAFGGLDGVLHSAGVLRDSFILRKTREELQDVLHAKVAGTLNLDAATRDLALDCFICFSSIASALGNVGQADYAAANGFMDAFAHFRDGLVAQGLRQGRSLAINWPLWEEGGMQVDAATRRYLLQEIGMTPLRSASGCTALVQALASGLPQVLVAEGHVERLKASLLTDAPAKPAVTQAEPAPVQPGEDLRDRTVRHLVRLLSATLKLPPHKIDAQVALEAYGIDSVLVMDLTQKLEKTFGPLPKTLFFEYQTIAALSGYFLQSHHARLVDLLGEKHALPLPSVAAGPHGAVVPAVRKRLRSGMRLDSRLALRNAGNATGEIAIIGLSGRYPQAGDVAAFWSNLSTGKDSITEIPASRWDWRTDFDEDRSKAGKTYSKWGGFIEGVDEFDPLFFNISPREAELMDPQERLFLQCVHATLEDAGYTRDSVAADQNVGVFVGVMYEEYQLYGAQEQARGHKLAVFNSPASIANRISYYCNFSGPSLALDTMCSSSLTAIHLACQSLRQGNCTVAVAGGVNVSVHPNKYLMLAQGKFISGKGRCESFGEGGEGYVPGEGVGAILLKPLAQAQADGDHIYGVIKASAINHGGKTNGYTVPNPNAQAKVIARALRDGGIDARDISYIEAHGTGTSLGDPIEIAGLAKAFSQWTQDKQYCAIGSAKSNIGHCESAAGIAGVTKVLLQLKHRQIAPSLHSSILNPNIDFEGTPFVVQQELTDWLRPTREVGGRQQEGKRIAGISSFGAGGA